MDAHIQDKIDNYLLNRMSEEERTAFEAEMEVDKELKKQYMFTKVLKQELSERASLKEKMKRWDKERAYTKQNEVKQVATQPTRKWMFAAASIAAVVLIGLFLHIETHSYTPENGNGSSLNTPSTIPDEYIRESNQFAFDEEVKVLMDNKEYQKALDLIEAKIEENDKRIIFNEKYSENKDGVDENEDAPTQEEAQESLKEEREFQGELLLMKVQVLLALGEKDKAIAILEDLTNKDLLIHERAKELLKQTKLQHFKNQ